MKIKKAIIPVAGKGTRFLPATKAVPKELIPIISTPMIYYVVKEALDAGIEEVIFVASEGKEGIIDFFKPNPRLESFLVKNSKEKILKELQSYTFNLDFKVVYQKEQLGLGHAVLQGKSCIDEGESFAVLLGDDLVWGDNPVTKQLVEVSEANDNSTVIGVMEVPREDVGKYGIVKGSFTENPKTLKMDMMVEKPKPEESPSTLATPGRYVLSYEIFNCLEEIPRGAGGEYQLTDAINLLCSKESVFAHIFEGDRFDTGNPLNYLEATIEMALRTPELKENFVKVLSNRLKSHGIVL